jgi:hypothetical protein
MVSHINIGTTNVKKRSQAVGPATALRAFSPALLTHKLLSGKLYNAQKGKRETAAFGIDFDQRRGLFVNGCGQFVLFLYRQNPKHLDADLAFLG